MAQKKIEEITEIFNRPLLDLVNQSHATHRQNFKPDQIQASSLLSIKTGGCPENCSYCPQSAYYSTVVEKTKLLDKKAVLDSALNAKAMGASRFCMGAAWRSVKDGKEFDEVIEFVKCVKEVGLEVCCTLGMLNSEQAKRLKNAGLFAYNHNIDTSRDFYSKVIQTRSYDDRLQTIENVRKAGLTVCTGGILGMGETVKDRIAFIHQLASFVPQPESITINTLVPFKGTPLENQVTISSLEVVRVIATIRIVAQASMIRLSAGRVSMNEESQFLCFLSGANSIFIGDKLLTSPNSEAHLDKNLLDRLGYRFSETGSIHG